jgi:hypothetical protein
LHLRTDHGALRASLVDHLAGQHCTTIWESSRLRRAI